MQINVGAIHIFKNRLIEVRFVQRPDGAFNVLDAKSLSDNKPVKCSATRKKLMGPEAYYAYLFTVPISLEEARSSFKKIFGYSRDLKCARYMWYDALNDKYFVYYSPIDAMYEAPRCNVLKLPDDKSRAIQETIQNVKATAHIITKFCSKWGDTACLGVIKITVDPLLDLFISIDPTAAAHYRNRLEVYKNYLEVLKVRHEKIKNIGSICYK